MPQTTPRNAIPYPLLSDPPNANTAFGNMLAPIDSNTIVRNPTAAGTVITTNGQIAYANDKDVFLVRDPSFTARQMGHTSVVVKSSDTSRASTTTLAADPHLTFAATANGVYFVQMEIYYHGIAVTPGIKFGFTGPTGWAGKHGWIMMGSHLAGTAPPSGSAGTQATIAGVNATGTVDTITGASSANTFCALYEGLWRTSSTAGTISLTWAQATLSASASVVRTNSYLQVTRISV